MTDPLSSPSPHFTAEHEEFRASVRTFFRKEVVPYAAEWERRRAMPRSAWHAFAAEGLLGLNHPTSVGGAGLDFFHSVVFLEELGRTGFGGVRFAVALHAYMGTSYLATNGSPELRQRYLRPAVAGDLIAALAITEPQAGSDLARLEATAVEDGDHLVVDAEKRFIVNGGFADFFVTAVRTGSANCASTRETCHYSSSTAPPRASTYSPTTRSPGGPRAWPTSACAGCGYPRRT